MQTIEEFFDAYDFAEGSVAELRAEVCEYDDAVVWLIIDAQRSGASFTPEIAVELDYYLQHNEELDRDVIESYRADLRNLIE